jgi:hypothetical protein
VQICLGVTAPEQRQQGANGRRSSCRGGYGLRKLAQQDQEECVVLTEAGIGRRRGGGRSSTTAGGGDGRCSWGGVLPRVSGLLVPTSRFSVELGSQGNGQRSRRNAGGEELQRRTDLTCGNVGSNPACSRAEAAPRGLGDDPRLKTVPLQWPLAVMTPRSSRSMAMQDTQRGGASGRSARGSTTPWG